MQTYGFWTQLYLYYKEMGFLKLQGMNKYMYNTGVGRVQAKLPIRSKLAMFQVQDQLCFFRFKDVKWELKEKVPVESHTSWIYFRDTNSTRGFEQHRISLNQPSSYRVFKLNYKTKKPEACLERKDPIVEQGSTLVYCSDF